MSLNKTLDRLFDEIRREAKRNPAFADRLDAVLRGHASRREVDEEALAEDAAEPAPQSPPSRSRGRAKPAAPSEALAPAAPAINPVGVYKREGLEALEAALEVQDLAGLRALVEEHNLDPSGETGGLDREALAAHVAAQAKRRAERDEKMFDY